MNLLDFITLGEYVEYFEAVLHRVGWLLVFVAQV